MRLIAAWSWNAALPADMLDEIGTAQQQELAGEEGRDNGEQVKASLFLTESRDSSPCTVLRVE